MSYTMRRGLSGLGDCNCMAVDDLVAQCGGTGTGACDPRDPQCIANNQAIIDWAETIQDANFGGCGPCIPPGTTCSGAPTSASLTAFLADQPIYTPAAGTPNGPSGLPYLVSSVSSLTTGNPNTPSVYTWSDGSKTSTPIYGQGVIASAPANVNNPVQATVQTTSSGAAIVNSSGAGPVSSGSPASSTTNVTPPTGNWFTDSTQEMISGIPNWGLLAAAGVALFAVMGGSHGR